MVAEEAHGAFMWGNLRGNDQLENPDIDSRIILERIFKKSVEMAWTQLMWIWTGTRGGTCRSGDKPSGSIKFGEFLEKPKNCNFTIRTLLHGLSWLMQPEGSLPCSQKPATNQTYTAHSHTTCTLHQFH
jgi:hypothetical protein